MEAGSKRYRVALTLAALTFLVVSPVVAEAGSRRTRNFIVQAPDDQMAHAVAEAAEKFRHDLAIYWLGEPLPPWPTPCPIRVIAGPNLAAQGVTTYNPRPVRDFQMEVVGTRERILDSVLPHEVTHTVLATHFGRPLPRWADEGICTTVEHSAERNKHEIMLRQFLASKRGIAMNQLFLMTEYPDDVLPMYAQGYSVCRFLIDQKGPREFIHFLQDYMQHPSWTDNVRKHYKYDSLKELQEYWLAWVTDGGLSVDRFTKLPSQTPGLPQQMPGNSQPEIRLASNEISAAPNQRQPMQLSDPRGSKVRPAAATAPATQLAANHGDGWYQRKRAEVQSGRTAPVPGNDATVAQVPNNRRAGIPPSVQQSGPYRTAHPQPMQGTGIPSSGMSPTPVPNYPASGYPVQGHPGSQPSQSRGGYAPSNGVIRR